MDEERSALAEDLSSLRDEQWDQLAKRVRAANAKVVGPSWLLDQLVD